MLAAKPARSAICCDRIQDDSKVLAPVRRVAGKRALEVGAELLTCTIELAARHDGLSELAD
jgi:hypothetical protein